MKNTLRPALTLLVLLSALTGLVYPVVVSGVARTLFPEQAAGSLIVQDDKPVGSALIGQNFTSPKYFAIIPAMFVSTYPQLGALNVMRLASPSSAILSAVIFNALIIVFLIPLALKGVRYRPVGAAALLRRNLAVYGLGGLGVPCSGIKLIDWVLVAVGLV